MEIEVDAGNLQGDSAEIINDVMRIKHSGNNHHGLKCVK